MCHPSHIPTVPPPVFPYAGDATPSHAHRILSSGVSYSIAFSFLSFSYRSRITIVSPVLPHHSCIHHIVTVVPGTIVPVYLFCSPVLPRHSGIHHTLHYARDYHSRTIVMPHRSTRRPFHLVARNYCSRTTALQHHSTSSVLYATSSNTHEHIHPTPPYNSSSV